MSTATTRRPARAGASPGRALGAPADEGIIVAIVAVTGTEDQVQDIIVPGAFAATLKRRRPKVCFNHSWADPIGRVLHIEELLPGDRRLPKRLPDGRSWPKEAGAVVATMQFHLATARGREMFEHAKEWANAGEACFSIGYKPNPKRTTRRGDGVRLIYELDLFELSLVLFGAHDMALALEVKAGKPTPFILNDPTETNWVEEAGGLPPYIREVANALVRDRGFSQEHAIATAVNRMKRWAAGMDDVKPDTIARAAANLAQWEAMRAAAAVEGKALDLDTQDAPPGMAAVVEPDDLGDDADDDTPDTGQPDFTDSAMVALYPSPDVASGVAVEGGTPADDLHVTVAFLGDAANIDGDALAAELSEALAGVGGLSGQVGGIGTFPEGENGTPVWAPVDVPRLDQLRVLVTDALEAAGHGQRSEHGFTPHMTLGYDLDALDPVPPTPVEFTEATLVVGGQKWPLPLTVDAPAPVMEGKAAAHAVAMAKATHPPMLEGKAAAAVYQARRFPTTQEKKMMPNSDLPGSFQSTMSALGRALDDQYRKDQEGDRDAVRSVWVHMEATFPDSVIYTVTDESATGDDAQRSYQAAYTLNADGTVDLGEPEPVSLTMAIVPDDDEDDDVSPDEATDARFTLPLVDTLRSATAILAASPVEAKGITDTIRPAFDDLLDQLAAKGLNYSEDPDDWSDVLPADEDEDGEVLDADAALGADDDADPVTTEEDELGPDQGYGVDEDTVTVDPAELDADMAYLTGDEDDEDYVPV